MDNSQSTRERVIELLNDAAFQSSEKEKIALLSKIQEIVIHVDSRLLDSFFEEIVAFQTDRNGDVRKFVVGFIEESCKKDNAMLPRLVPNIEILLADETMAVVKRVIQAASQLQKFSLAWIASSKQKSQEMEQTWEIIGRIKNSIIQMIDHDNDGVRTQSIKFLESVILVQTYTEADSIQRAGEFSLDQVPLTLKITRPRKLEEEARNIFSKLVSFQGSLHISSVNLMTCMSSLSIIARARPFFMEKVIESFEILHANLPPTLGKSQVNSVRKHLKIQLLNLGKHPRSIEYHKNIIAILQDLGLSAAEIDKALPSKDGKKRKRAKSPEVNSSSDSKRIRVEKSKVTTESSDKKTESMTAVEMTAKWILEKLNLETVTDLVMSAMLHLPDSMPAFFGLDYSPVTAPGSDSQKQQVSRWFASQLTAAGVGPGAEKMKKEEKASGYQSDEEKESEQFSATIDVVGSVKSSKLVSEGDRQSLAPAGFTRAPHLSVKSRQVKLTEITQPMSIESRNSLSLLLLKRILGGENTHRLYGKGHRERLQIISRFSMFASSTEMTELEEFVFEDLPSHLDLLQSWLYSHHASSSDFSQLSRLLNPDQVTKTYDQLLEIIVKRILDMTPNKERDELLNRILVESPTIPIDVMKMLALSFNQGQEAAKGAAETLKDIALWRPCHSKSAVELICVSSAHNDQNVREMLEPIIIDLYAKEAFRNDIGDYTEQQLISLMEPVPKKEFFGEHVMRVDTEVEWSEDVIKAVLFLPFMLLPYKQHLIHELAKIYVKAVNEVKRSILRLLETPVSQMGMDSPTLLSLVEECPKGSETLITRIIHVLTEKAPPSEELVHHVRELYNKRVSDVRFLIPVLTGLTKREVISVLPKLIKLNPHVVREVFNRLWGITLDKGNSPVSPVELLVALHLIPSEKCDVKTVIKATGLCINEKTIYTSEVLAKVLQQLLEQPNLPTLFMRTVIQALGQHQKLVGFVMNILTHLISKEIWQHRKAWEGFIKCCERAVPQSFNVLRQLPAAQLGQVFIESPQLQTKLAAHLESLTDIQRAPIPAEILDVIRNPPNRNSPTEPNIEPQMPMAAEA